MSLRRLLVALSFITFANVAQAADAGIYTIVDGEARVLRGTTWYRLAAGARVEDGDIVDAGNRTQLQLELARGGRVSVQGPLAMLVAVASANDAAPAELTLQRAWAKIAVAEGRRPLRMRLPTLTVDLADGVVVLHSEAGSVELFIETGVAKVSVPVVRGKDAPARDAKAGEFWTRAGERPPTTSSRPAATFVAAMPRELRDALPELASRFPVAPASLATLREVTLAEAEPWVAGPARRAFLRRFTPRLADPEFRAAVSARPSAFPEWDRILHPEKYRPKVPVETPAQ